jgi:hypothetical protein
VSTVKDLGKEETCDLSDGVGFFNLGLWGRISAGPHYLTGLEDGQRRKKHVSARRWIKTIEADLGYWLLDRDPHPSFKPSSNPPWKQQNHFRT